MKTVYYQKIRVAYLKQMSESQYYYLEIKVKVGLKKVVRNRSYHQFLKHNQNKRKFRKEMVLVKVEQGENRFHRQLVKSNLL